jgi:transcriptional regulator of acetoin/glycerol metabolism
MTPATPQEWAAHLGVDLTEYRRRICKAVIACGGSAGHAAHELGLHKKSVYRLARTFNLAFGRGFA